MISLSLQARQNPALARVLAALEAIGAEEVGDGAENRPKLIEATASLVNTRLERYGDDISTFDSVSFAIFHRAINSVMMVMTQRTYSLKDGSDLNEARYGCVYRKLQLVDLAARSRASHSHPLGFPSEICKAGFIVRRTRRKSDDKFCAIVFPRDEPQEHFSARSDEERACPVFPLSFILKNENYVKGVFTDFLKDQLRSMAYRLRSNDAALRRSNIRRQADALCKEYGLGICPESVLRSLEDDVDVALFGGNISKDKIDLHKVSKLIERFNRDGWAFKTYEVFDCVEAIFWVDPRHRELDRHLDIQKVSNRLTHDTTFGVASPQAGYEKMSLLIGEYVHGSQLLVAGLMISDNYEYFRVMMDFCKEQYPDLTTKPELYVMSDEDRAFIKASQEILPQATTSICVWHKMKNFKKPRKAKKVKTDASASAQSSVKDGEESDDEDDGEEEELI
jgi:hypothetical protein